MFNFDFYNPTRILFGNDRLAGIGEQIGYYGTAVPRFRRSGNRLSGSGNRCSDGVSRLSGAADADTKLLLG